MRAGLLERSDLAPREKERACSKGDRRQVVLVAAFASDMEALIFPTEHLKKEHDVRVHGSRAAPGRP
ncbi:hypothetical protein [Streptosporangium roseum]|uniref:hypothetical protein n=1 Tax=Streptosporangium roseum TaxID=2001 RepID=UPI0004CDD9D3|nr:hypothetical protein [Streptosporangium roseum]